MGYRRPAVLATVEPLGYPVDRTETTAMVLEDQGISLEISYPKYNLTFIFPILYFQNTAGY